MGKKNISDKSCREKWNTFYFPYSFPLGITISVIIKQKDFSVHIIELAYLTINHGFQNTTTHKQKGQKAKKEFLLSLLYTYYIEIRFI
jgi:hypothetical protein